MTVMLVAAVSGVFQKSFKMSKKCLWVVFKVIKKMPKHGKQMSERFSFFDVRMSVLGKLCLIPF